MSYDVGQVHTAAVEVRNSAGQLANATTVTLTITRVGSAVAPDVLSLPTIQNPSTGKYTYDKLLDTAGLYRFDWVTQVPGVATTDYQNVLPFVSVLSLADAREYVGAVSTLTDQKLRGMMAAATRLAESVVGVIVPRTITDEFVPGYVREVIRVPRPPVLSKTSVSQIRSIYTATGGPVWNPADYDVFPEAGTVYPLNRIAFWGGPWRIDYVGGRLLIEEHLVSGVKEILWDLFAPYRNQAGDSDIPELGDLAGFEAALPSYRIPGRALEYLESDRIPGFA